MGLIKAAFGSAGGVLADQWKEYFYCEALPETVIATKGQKRISGRSSNKKGNDNKTIVSVNFFSFYLFSHSRSSPFDLRLI